jgi:peptide/nickel transport system substrate-binding protein
MPTVSADSLTYTVKIRQDAKWSDGTPITADDVVMTHRMAANPNLNTNATFDWSPLTDPVTGITKVDTYTVKYTLSTPFAPFLATNLAGFIAPAEVYGKIDPAKMLDDPSNQAPTVTGGPFLYTGRTPGQEIDGKANPSYYNGRAHFDKLVEKVFTNSTATVQALGTGDINMDPNISGSAIDTAKGLSGVNNYVYPDLSYFDVRLNDRAGHLFGDLAVRKAWLYVIDHDGVVAAATAGHATPLYGDLPPASWAYDPAATPAYPKQDVAKAKTMLAAAGWTPGSDGILQKNGKKFVADFCVRSDQPDRVKAVTIMAQQAQAVGMQLTVKPIDFRVFYGSKAKGGCGVQDGTFELAFAGFGLSLDPDNYTIFSSKFIRPENNPSGANYGGFSDPSLDAALLAERTDVKATDAATKAARKADFAKVEKILSDNVVSYFMWAPNVGQGFQSKVQGIVAGGSGNDLNYADQERNVQVFAQWYFKGGS